MNKDRFISKMFLRGDSVILGELGDWMDEVREADVSFAKCCIEEFREGGPIPWRLVVLMHLYYCRGEGLVALSHCCGLLHGHAWGCTSSRATGSRASKSGCNDT